jgi:hypothetical protein
VVSEIEEGADGVARLGRQSQGSQEVIPWVTRTPKRGEGRTIDGVRRAAAG